MISGRLKKCGRVFWCAISSTTFIFITSLFFSRKSSKTSISLPLDTWSGRLTGAVIYQFFALAKYENIHFFLSRIWSSFLVHKCREYTYVFYWLPRGSYPFLCGIKRNLSSGTRRGTIFLENFPNSLEFSSVFAITNFVVYSQKCVEPMWSPIEKLCEYMDIIPRKLDKIIELKGNRLKND